MCILRCTCDCDLIIRWQVVCQCKVILCLSYLVQNDVDLNGGQLIVSLSGLGFGVDCTSNNSASNWVRGNQDLSDQLRMRHSLLERAWSHMLIVLMESFRKTCGSSFPFCQYVFQKNKMDVPKHIICNQHARCILYNALSNHQTPHLQHPLS